MTRILISLLIIVSIGGLGWYFVNKYELFDKTQISKIQDITNKTTILGPEEVGDLGFFIQDQVLYDENENSEEKVPNPKIIKAKYRYFKLEKINSGKYKDFQTYLVETNELTLGGYGTPSGKIYYMIAVNNGKMVVFYDKSLYEGNYEKEQLENRIDSKKLQAFDTFELPVKLPETLSNGNILILQRSSNFEETTLSSIFGLLKDYINNPSLKKIATVQNLDVYSYENKENKTTYYLVNFNGVLAYYYSSIKGFDKISSKNIEGTSTFKAETLKLKNNEVAYQTFRLFVPPCTQGASPYDLEKDLNFKVKDSQNLIKVTSDDEVEVLKFKNLNSKENEELINKIKQTVSFYNEKGKYDTREPEIKDLENGGILIYKDIFGIYRAMIRKDLIYGGCGKPVVYLYPEKETKVTLSFVNPINFTTVIPNYKNNWEVLAHTNGILNDLKPQLTDCNSFENKHGSEYAKEACEKNQYPYLYWSGNTIGINYPDANNGFIVKKDNLNNFFDEKLSTIGFNQKEISDFKEYWVPYLSEKNSQYLRITFFQNEIVNQMFPMRINPLPKNSIRMFMDWGFANSNSQIAEQKLISYPRKEFTLVEWGGLKK